MGKMARKVGMPCGNCWWLDGDHVINLLAHGKQQRAFQEEMM